MKTDPEYRLRVRKLEGERQRRRNTEIVTLEMEGRRLLKLEANKELVRAEQMLYELARKVDNAKHV